MTSHAQPGLARQSWSMASVQPRASSSTLYIARPVRLLLSRGVTVERSYIGEFITSLQMAGLSLTVTLLDDELLALLDAPVSAR